MDDTRNAGSFFDLLRTFTTVEGAAGQTLRFYFDGAPRERHGRPVHLVGLHLVLTLVVATVAATMATALRGFNVRLAVQNVFLQAFGGHLFLDNVNGDALSERYRALFGVDFETVTDIPDADNAALSKNFTLVIPFAVQASSTKPWDNALPVNLFAARRSGEECFRFLVASGNLNGFAGVTVTNLSGTVLGEYVALEAPRLPTPFRFYMLDSLQPDDTIDAGGPIDLLVQRDVGGSNAAGAGDPDHSGYGTINLDVGGEPLFQTPLTALQLAAIENLRKCDLSALANQGTNSQFNTSTTAPERLMYINNMLRGTRNNTRKTEGLVRIRRTVAASHFPRYYVQTTGRKRSDLEAAWMLAVGGAGASLVSPKGTKKGKTVDASVIPSSVVHAASPHVRTRQKFVQKAQAANQKAA